MMLYHPLCRYRRIRRARLPRAPRASRSRHPAVKSLCPVAGDGVHVPGCSSRTGRCRLRLRQVSPASKTFPQAPQLFEVVLRCWCRRRSAGAPSGRRVATTGRCTFRPRRRPPRCMQRRMRRSCADRCPRLTHAFEQMTSLPGQVSTHVPLLQNGRVALLPCPQTFPQSAVVCVVGARAGAQAPAVATVARVTPSQSISPERQAHFLSLQLAPGSQTMPHPPQFCPSVSRSAHPAPPSNAHAVWPAGHWRAAGVHAEPASEAGVAAGSAVPSAADSRRGRCSRSRAGRTDRRAASHRGRSFRPGTATPQPPQLASSLRGCSSPPGRPPPRRSCSRSGPPRSRSRRPRRGPRPAARIGPRSRRSCWDRGQRRTGRRVVGRARGLTGAAAGEARAAYAQRHARVHPLAADVSAGAAVHRGRPAPRALPGDTADELPGGQTARAGVLGRLQRAVAPAGQGSRSRRSF